jgi:hypothetical protein
MAPKTARRLRRNRSVVDDAPAPWRLRLHHPHRFLRAQKRPGQIHGHARAPLLVREIFHRHRRRTGAGIIEQQIEPSKLSLQRRKQCPYTFRLPHIRRHRDQPSARRRSHRHRLLELGDASSRHRDVVPGALQRQRRRPPNATPATRDQCCFCHIEVYNGAS